MALTQGRCDRCKKPAALRRKLVYVPPGTMKTMLLCPQCYEGQKTRLGGIVRKWLKRWMPA